MNQNGNPRFCIQTVGLLESELCATGHSALIECQEQREADQNRSNDALLPSSESGVASKPAGKGRREHREQQAVHDADRRDDEAECDELEKNAPLFRPYELREECEEEERDLRIQYVRDQCA